MKKAIVYCRVSTQSQKDEGTSLESQREACLAHAEQLGYSVVRTEEEVFSGAYLFDRPKFSSIREDVRHGEVDAVIMYAVDRLTRNIAHLYIIQDEFEKTSTELVFVTEAFDMSAEGKLLQSVKSYVAEVEREKIRERTMRGRKTKALTGTLSNKRPLFGFSLDEDGNRVPCPVNAPVVKEIFQSIIRGESLRSTADNLSRQGILTPAGQSLWWAYTVSNIVKNPAYAGRPAVFRYRKNSRTSPEDWVTLTDSAPAIVTWKEFEAVQTQLVVNRKEKRAKPRLEFLLRGLVRCSRCGRLLSPRVCKTYRAYVCTSAQNRTAHCKVKMLGANKAEALAWKKAEELINEPEALRQLVAEHSPPPKDDLRDIKKSITKTTADIRRMEANVVQADPRSFEALNKLLSARHDDLRRLCEVRDDIISRDPSNIDFQDLRKIENWSFTDKVNALKMLGVAFRWDGVDLKLNLKIRYGSKSDINKNRNLTVFMLLDLTQ